MRLSTAQAVLPQVDNMMKGKGFELDEIDLGGGNRLPFAKEFMHEGTRWSVTENVPLVSNFFISGGDKPEHNAKRYLHLYRASSGTEIKYALQSLFYDAPDHPNLTILSMSNTRPEGMYSFLKVAKDLLDRSNVPDGEAKRHLDELLKEVAGRITRKYGNGGDFTFLR